MYINIQRNKQTNKYIKNKKKKKERNRKKREYGNE